MTSSLRWRNPTVSCREKTQDDLATTGQQYQIVAGGGYRATVTELGAGLRELLFRDQPLIAGYGADELPPGAAGQLLAPWPNRIDGGRYLFGGTDFQLALTEPEHSNAIHGLTRWMAWIPVRHGPAP
jgi:aldose 1-epimerase